MNWFVFGGAEDPWERTVTLKRSYKVVLFGENDSARLRVSKAESRTAFAATPNSSVNRRVSLGDNGASTQTVTRRGA